MDEPASHTGTRYLRIVAEIRHRIASGELAAGERVPSARQITRDWGVAIATATRVLATLRQEGLVRTVPGVGTVVDAHRKSTAPPPRIPRRRDARELDQELTPERILRAAIVIADAEGLAALSMRRIAAELGVATMSLYRHVRSKDDLILRMADAALGEDPLPGARAREWRAQLAAVARLQWVIYRRHPWLPQVISMTRPQLLPAGMAHTEWALRAVDGLGLDANTMLHMVVTLFSYVRGNATNFEMQAQAEQDTGVTDDQWIEAQGSTFAAIFATGRYPTLSNITTESGVGLTLDTLFEFGLRRLLDGYAALVHNTPPRG